MFRFMDEKFDKKEAPYLQPLSQPNHFLILAELIFHYYQLLRTRYSLPCVCLHFVPACFSVILNSFSVLWNNIPVFQFNLTLPHCNGKFA